MASMASAELILLNEEFLSNGYLSTLKNGKEHHALVMPLRLVKDAPPPPQEPWDWIRKPHGLLIFMKYAFIYVSGLNA